MKAILIKNKSVYNFIDEKNEIIENETDSIDIELNEILEIKQDLNFFGCQEVFYKGYSYTIPCDWLIQIE